MGKKTLFNNGNGLKLFLGDKPPEHYYKTGISSIYGVYPKSSKNLFPYWKNKNFLSNMYHVKSLSELQNYMYVTSVYRLAKAPYNWAYKNKYIMQDNKIIFDHSIFNDPNNRDPMKLVVNIDVLSIDYMFDSKKYNEILDKYLFIHSYTTYKHIDFLIHELDYTKFKEIKNYLEAKDLCVSDNFLGDPV
jgi:hypothetical protein